MSRKGINLERNLVVVQPLTCFFHNRQIACTAHNNAY
ncbi:Uncharacterised protein [Segatella copri]|nr:Uncharacterised protein [Segatella copri]